MSCGVSHYFKPQLTYELEELVLEKLELLELELDDVDNELELDDVDNELELDDTDNELELDDAEELELEDSDDGTGTRRC